MREPWVDPTYFAMCFLAIGGATLGILEALIPPRRWPWAIPALLLMLILGGAAAWLLGQPAPIWIPPFGLAVVGGLLRGFRSSCVGRIGAWTWRCLRDPRLQGTALLVLTPVLVIGWACRVEQEQLSAETYVNEWSPELDALGLQEVQPGLATTDRGRPLPVFNPPHVLAAGPLVLAKEATYLTSQDFNQRLIRTAPPDDTYNCHGWIFAAGQHWIKGREVETILEDNGYEPVTSPRENDLVIFRNPDGSIILHSALVRHSGADGLVLVESKWGRLGRFLHTPNEHVYGSQWTYYRSPRQGHLLRGFSPPTSERIPSTGTPAN